MSKKVKIITGLICGLLLLGSFWAGRMVQADMAVQPDPGSVQDPLVTQSYVDSQLRAQVQTLQERIVALENRVAALEARTGSAPPVVTPPASGTTPPSAGTTPSEVKKVYPRNAGSTINVRTGPSTKYPVMGKITANSPGTYISERSGWYLVKLSNGKSGWASGDVTRLR